MEELTIDHLAILIKLQGQDITRCLNKLNKIEVALKVMRYHKDGVEWRSGIGGIKSSREEAEESIAKMKEFITRIENRQC